MITRLIPLLLAAVITMSAPGWAHEAGGAAVAAGEPAPKADAAPVAGYDKGFFIQGADVPFKLKLQARVQARYALDVLDGEEDETAFSIPRARLTLGGHAFTKALGYKFQIDFGKGFVTLKDFYVNYRLVPDWLEIRVGQWKRPFSRQQINSSGRLELVDRAITDKFFGAGRDIGLAIHNDFEHSPTFEYALGLFNGTGDKPKLSGDVTVDANTGEGEITGGKFANVPDRLRPTVVLRLGYNYGGIKGYREADLEGGSLRIAVGASGLAEIDAAGKDDSSVRAELDYALKVQGFSTTGAVYVSSAQSGGGFFDQSFEAIGFHVQAGYVIAGRVHPAVRYALIAKDGADNDLQEILAGLSVYFWGHRLKWQTDGGTMITEDAGGRQSDYLVRTQLQLSI